MYCSNHPALFPRDLSKKCGYDVLQLLPSSNSWSFVRKMWVRCAAVINQLSFHVIWPKNVGTMYCSNYPSLVPRNLSKMWARCTAVITQLYFHVICPKNVGTMYCSNHPALVPRNLSKKCGHDVLLYSNYPALFPRDLFQNVATMYCSNYPALFPRNFPQKMRARCTAVITQLYFHVVQKMWVQRTTAITQLYFHVIFPKKCGYDVLPSLPSSNLT